MSLGRYFANLKKRDLSSKQSEAGDDTKKKREKIAQLQVSERMMMFFWKD